MKKLQLAAMVAGVVLLAGCGNKAAENQPVPSTENKQAEVNADTQAPENSVIASIKDAMSSGKTMKCTYTIKGKDGDMTSISYVDGKKYLSETTVAGKVMHSLFDETAMYTWTEGMKQGMKMDMTCAQDLAKNAPQGDQSAQAPDPSGEKTFDSATDVTCEPASNIDFSIPTDVTFADQCAMLKNVMKNIPSGANIPKGMPVNLPTDLPQAP